VVLVVVVVVGVSAPSRHGGDHRARLSRRCEEPAWRRAIDEHLEPTLGDRCSPPKLLSCRNKVAAGELGKKSRRGFCAW
jgi:hypothetical protein